MTFLAIGGGDGASGVSYMSPGFKADGSSHVLGPLLQASLGGLRHLLAHQIEVLRGPSQLECNELRLVELGELNDDWDGDGAPAPSKTSIARSGILLARCHAAELYPNRISPSVEGGVVFGFADGEIELDNEGDVFSVLAIGDTVQVTQLTSGDFSDALKRLSGWQ